MKAYSPDANLDRSVSNIELMSVYTSGHIKSSDITLEGLNSVNPATKDLFDFKRKTVT